MVRGCTTFFFYLYNDPDTVYAVWTKTNDCAEETQAHGLKKKKQSTFPYILPFSSVFPFIKKPAARWVSEIANKKNISNPSSRYNPGLFYVWCLVFILYIYIC